MEHKKYDFIQNSKINYCLYGPNFIDFGEHLRKFYILSENGEREMIERERKIDHRGEVAKIRLNKKIIFCVYSLNFIEFS